MSMADQEMAEMQYHMGGGIKYLECDANAKLIHFYEDLHSYRLFGERISTKDQKRYLQYAKFF